MESQPGSKVLGAILAGGASRRFGSAKGLAEIGGMALIDRVRAALQPVVGELVVLAPKSEAYLNRGLRCVPDLRPGMGPLAGLETALTAARQAGQQGVVLVACDMPFLSTAILRRIILLSRSEAARIVIPESDSPAGVEPLCAWYSTALLERVTDLLDGGDRSLHPLASGVGTVRIPRVEVRRYGDPARIFLNVNTPEDLTRAISLHSAHS